MQREILTGNILIVDDEPVSLKLLVSFLERQGFATSVATGGEEAMAVIAQKLPDIILLDIMMPMMDGFEVCAALKENPATADIPVIFVTALTTLDDKVKGFSVGGVDYVTKPFQHEEVLARVTTHLKISSLHKQLESKNKQLMAVLDEVRQLSCILPICAMCKKPRNDGQYWQLVDKFMASHEGARFTHSFCPDCKRSSSLGDLQKKE
jgi:DNA-binding response OmpR family regulator